MKSVSFSIAKNGSDISDEIDFLTNENWQCFGASVTDFGSCCGKLTANYAEKLNSSPRRKVKRTKNTLSIDSQFQFKKTKNVESLSTLFENKEFCVLTGLEESITKNGLEMKIIQNGGNVVQHPGVETYCVIASEITVRVSNVIQLNKYNIVKPQWLIACIENNKFNNWRPDDFLAITPETSEEISQKFDRFGDSYEEVVNLNGLRRILNSMELNENDRVDLSDMIELDKMLFDGENPYAIFRGCFAYFYDDSKNCVCNPDDMYKEIFKFYGGCEQQDVNEQTTHFILNVDKLPTDLEELNKGKGIQVVNKNWILESAYVNTRLSETVYIVKVT